MLERLVIRNFKRFETVELELGDAVLFVGPNNSGKTTALQALALWELGARRWNEKRGKSSRAKKRTGVAINRRDLVTVPVPDASLFWNNLHLREVSQVGGKKKTENVRIEIEVTGVTDETLWKCGLEFDFANSESIYCRPLEATRSANGQPPFIPPHALTVNVAFLPPMSGLAANETRLDPGAIQVRIGEGRTAEVLRNLCYQIHQRSGEDWDSLVMRISNLFGVTLEAPVYIQERGEIAMTYRDLGGLRLDLSASGRGLQQTLLLLAYVLLNPSSVLLLDEPDAHLEILRQRQIYQTLTELLRERASQLVAASHSEVLLNEAADRDVVVAFVGRPHRIDDRGSQVLKSLKSIGFEHYYQAEQTGWVLYLEGSTDLAILQAFANTLEHPAAEVLERPFVHYVENKAKKAETHFFGLREAKQDLVGFCLLDHLSSPPSSHDDLTITTWRRREIENYLCFPEVLEAYAAARAETTAAGPLFVPQERKALVELMRECIRGRIVRDALKNRQDRWWSTVKASDEFLDPLFAKFFEKQNLPNLMRKTDYHQLAHLVRRELIDDEVIEKLDHLVEIAEKARPRIWPAA
ncbi:MAG: AAA family ATPase [bacterium]|nr:AAA family ATPase [bacterium]